VTQYSHSSAFQKEVFLIQREIGEGERKPAQPESPVSGNLTVQKVKTGRQK
jgi:hypothetical protein